MYSFVTVPNATKLISTLSPNNTLLLMDRSVVWVGLGRLWGWLAEV